MKLVNRSVLVLKPTSKMLAWINNVGEKGDAVTMEEARGMNNAYLLPDFEDDQEQARYIRFRMRNLFEHELGSWCTDPRKWPSPRNHEAFRDWFQMEISHMVIDLGGDPIVLQPLNLTKDLDCE